MTIIQFEDGIDEAYEMEAAGFGFLSGNYEEATQEETFLALSDPGQAPQLLICVSLYFRLTIFKVKNRLK